MTWRMRPHCFRFLPLLAIFLTEHFTASNESLYVSPAVYHSISLHYLRETTKNKGRLVEFREKGSECEQYGRVICYAMLLRLWLCLHTEACLKAVTPADNKVINLWGGIYYICLTGHNLIHFLSGRAGHQSIITSSKHTRPPQYNPSHKEPRKWLAQCIMRQCLS